jgi:hypothetical protein
MWKSLIFAVLLVAVVSVDVPNNSSAGSKKSDTQVSANSTQQAKKQPGEISQNAAISEKNDHNSNAIKEEKNVGKGEAEEMNLHQNKETSIEDMDDTENFKYYWVLLVFSSLSIIGLIVFKSFRYIFNYR